MNPENKIPLLLLQEHLQDIEHYDNPDYAFSELLGAWRTCAHKSWYTGAKGWLSIDDAKSFSDYAGYNLLDD